MKKILSITLAIFILFSAVPITSLTASADTQTNTSLKNNNVKLKSDSGISALLQTAIEQENNADEEDIANQVLDVSVEDKTATVTFNNNVDCKLIVAIYDEETGEMAGSGIKTVEKDAEKADVTLDVVTMPEYFTVKVFILDENNKPLNKSFESIYYTQAHQEFLKKTTDDFDSDKVLNLDSDKKNNFAVFDDDTKQIEETEKNKLESKDDETKTYIFSNINEEISSLQEGDDFYYEYNDEYILVKVKSITIDGTNATIIGEQDVELDDIFSYVKIDEISNGEGITVDASNADEGVTYEGTVEPESKQRASVDIGASVKQKYKIDKEFKSKDESKKVAFGGSLELKLGASLKAELYWNYFSIEFKISPEFTASISVDGSMQSAKIHLGSTKIPLGATGLIAGVDIDFLAEASAKISYTVKQSFAIGFGFDTKKGFSNKSEPAKTTSEFSFEGTFFIGVKISPNIEVFAGVVKVELNGSGGFEIKGENLKKYELDENVVKHNCDVCIDGSLKFKMDLKVTLKVKLWFIKSESEFKIASLEVKIFDWYYNPENNKFGKGDCPNSSYKVIFTIKNTNGEKLTAATVNGQKVDDKGTLSIFCSPNDNSFEIKCDGYKAQNVCYVIKPEINKFIVTLKKASESSGDAIELSVINVSDFTYTTGNDGTATITKYTGNATNLIIPSRLGQYTVTRIANYAFSNCDKLSVITLPSTIKTIDKWAFRDCISLESILVSQKNNKFYSIDGVLFDKEKNWLLQYPMNKKGTHYSIPYGVKAIGDAAFIDCCYLESVTITETVTYMEWNAFYHCYSLKEITMPSSITNTGGWCFTRCYSLMKVNIKSQISSINEYMFSGCKQLTNVAIPECVTKIDIYAFNSCTSLKDVYYSGTQEQWENITIGVGNSYLTNATIHYNSTGSVYSTSLKSVTAMNYLADDTEDNTVINYKMFSKTGLVPNQPYVLMIITGNETDYTVDTASLKYITDAVSDENGNVDFDYLYNGEEDVVAVVYGARSYNVTIDNSVLEVNEDVFTFPQSTDKGFIAYTDGSNYYDVGDKVTISSDEVFTTISIGNVKMLEGASIRLGEVNGIRFYTDVDQDKIDGLKQCDIDVEMGTLIAPKDLIGSSELSFDLDINKYIDVQYYSDKYHIKDDFCGIVGSIVNIKQTLPENPINGNIERDFVGRGYVTVTIGDKKKTVYADYYNDDISNNSRSLKTVAITLKNDTSDSATELYSMYNNMIDSWSNGLPFISTKS